MLKEGGAKVVQRLYTPQEGRIECIVSDPNPTDYLAAKFRELEVPVVSKEWIVQSLFAQVRSATVRSGLIQGSIPLTEVAADGRRAVPLHPH